ncbi:MAG: ferritin family protein [Candidatus Tectomicrobia bacterium]|uniref:Ferritin family protein n=1 Tax=Tectimicrobiota bacterium TaxID=2528274 RepID=A0A932CNN8_UNCTE|nr:ferritin family protein [Candidatus Tectomicrobia bacterium]
MTEKYQEALDGLKQAIQLEIEGMKFFSRAAEVTRDPKGKEVFQRLAQSEARHYQILKAEHEALSQTGHWLSYQEAYPAQKAELPSQAILDSQEALQQIEEGTGDLEALKIAIELEKKAGNYFQEAAQRAQDPVAKEVFQRLAAEEETHLKLFEAEYDYVTRSGFYFDTREFSPELQ